MVALVPLYRRAEGIFEDFGEDVLKMYGDVSIPSNVMSVAMGDVERGRTRISHLRLRQSRSLDLHRE